MRQQEQQALPSHLDRALDEAETAQGGVIRYEAEPSGRDRPHHWGRPIALTLLGAFLVAFIGLSGALLVWPAGDRPQHVDGILSLDGANEHLREQRALGLARAGYAHVLLFSEGHYPKVPCPKLPHVEVVCFVPRPARTVGEIEFAARYAARHRWHSIMVVPGHTQTSRARLLLARCFQGRAIVVPAAAPPLLELPYQVAYEWGALVKALIVDPGC